MSNNPRVSAFEVALNRFKTDLKKKDLDQFKNVTLKDLITQIEGLQKTQVSQRRAKNLARLKPFLEAMEQFGRVAEVFGNTSEIVAFIWGPMKFLLQVTSAFVEAFEGLLEVYDKIGDSVRLLRQSESLFRDDDNMFRLLVLVYEDILQFHRQALKYFQQPIWRQLFQATWKTYRSRFDPLIENIRGHSRLIHQQATLSQIEDFRKDRLLQDTQLRSIVEKQRQEQFRDVCLWLHYHNVENDQDHYSSIRREFPGTGQWILHEPLLQDWMDPQFATIPPLLWINGIPGAGKTILTSAIVEAIGDLQPRPNLLYFYCKHGHSDRNTFAAIARTFLGQLLQDNKDILLPLYHEKYSRSVEPVLATQSVMETLLEVAVLSCSAVYIVIDGIDECARDARKKITMWFRHLVENLQPPRQDCVRCLFVSQDDGLARKDFNGLATLKIRNKDVMADIEKYSCASAAKIQSEFELSRELKEKIASKIREAAKGMFLLAKLIASNLMNQESLEEIEHELEDDVLPKELEEAYARIICRIFDQASPSQKAASEFLLDWLVCAKREMKWHEVNAAKAINIELQSVDLKGRGFLRGSKDLCGSLVEISDDGTVKLVHTTAKMYLVSKKVQVPRVEISMACLCIDYLSMPGFRDAGEVVSLVTSGYYAFLDYAISCWLRHLEDGLVAHKDEEDVLDDLPESLEAFLDHHFTSPLEPLPISQGNAKRLQVFEGMSFHQDLQQAVASTRKELTFLGDMSQTEVALDLSQRADAIRKVLEKSYIDAADGSEKDRLERIYGLNIFKCPRLSCQYFHNGFMTADQRDRHMDKHIRPFRCAVVGCPTYTLGLTSERVLEKHLKDTHGVSPVDDDDFPKEKELAGQRAPKSAAVQKPPQLTPSVPVVSKEKRVQLTDFPCPSCTKRFRKKYNLDSHLVTHSGRRDFLCSECGEAFLRRNDCNRHQRTHGDKEFTCGGCQKKFSRADALQNHHKSSAGQSCLIHMT